MSMQLFMNDAWSSISGNLASFVFWYPLVMSLFWIAGALVFIWFREKEVETAIDREDWPLISFLIPCYNEEQTIAETIASLDSTNYPNFEIIAVNDGSRDRTEDVLDELEKRYPNLRVIQCEENRGKANALHIAAHAAKAEYLVCLDSDALLDEDAPFHLIKHFLHKGERLGAVTGNPRIRNRSSLLSCMQLVEYASIIGIIKRTQRIIGKVMTVSGVVVAFRKKALLDVGLWERDMVTEDIAVSWQLQKRFWDIRYESRALCWMLVPETLDGIWKQRVRWAQGGLEVMFRHWKTLFSWKQRRIWPIYLEQLASTIWSFSWLLITLYILLTAQSYADVLLWLTFTSFALVFLSMIQLFIALLIDSRDDRVMGHYFWAAWYPAIYWMINALIVVSAFPKAVKSRFKGGYAIWSSPDRGIKEEPIFVKEEEEPIFIEEERIS